MVEAIIKIYGLLMSLALGGLALHVFLICLIANLVSLIIIIAKKDKVIVTNNEKIQFKHHN